MRLSELKKLPGILPELPLNQLDDPIDYEITKSVIGELIWVVGKQFISESNEILMLWGLKCVLQDTEKSADLRAAVWRQLVHIKENGSTIQGDQKKPFEDLMKIGIYFYTNGTNRTSPSDLIQTRIYCGVLIDYLPKDSRGYVLAGIGHKLGLLAI